MRQLNLINGNDPSGIDKAVFWKNGCILGLITGKMH